MRSMADPNYVYAPHSLERRQAASDRERRKRGLPPRKIADGTPGIADTIKKAIAMLEAELAADPRFRKLKLLKSLLTEYE